MYSGYLYLRYPGILDRRKWRPKEEMGEREGERERVTEREREREKCCFCLQNDLKEP